MIICVIPAKRESRRLTGKNLLTIQGKSLIEHSILYAKSSEKVAKVFVSTDSQEIEEHVKEYRVGVIRRRPELGGETPLMDVYRHAWREINDSNITYLVGIQSDHPDRVSSLDDAIDYALAKGIDDLFTVDRHGNRNGSLRILSKKAIETNSPIYTSAMMDNCTNIHTEFDFHMASFNLSTKTHEIQIGGHKIGADAPIFIIAEAACNHMCDIALAKTMIDRAAEAGVNAIKFQTYKAEKLVTKDAVAFWGDDKMSQVEYYRRLDRFGKNEYQELFKYAVDRGLVAFSSPFDAESTEMLAEIGMPVFKIASCDVPDLRHLRHIAGFGRPIILSTGASTPQEIDKAIEIIFSKGNYQLMLLACTLSYPTPNEEANLMRIRTLQERYPGMIIGISDHTEPDSHMVIPSMAVALGAKIVEKHYTLDRSMTGSGHFFAVDPQDLKKMVQNIRLAETVLGDGSLGVADSEKRAWESARRSIVAEIPIPKGTVITSDMLGIKRPAIGLPASMIDGIVGRRARLHIPPDEYIFESMLENEQD